MSYYLINGTVVATLDIAAVIGKTLTPYQAITPANFSSLTSEQLAQFKQLQLLK